MPNTYFKCKKFRIDQDKAPMKVGTDGFLLGAWVNCYKAKSILDIGTGTGLIALILAQKSNHAIIDAIDIDKNTFLQAKKNFLQSPWSERINIFHTSLQEFMNQCKKKYDIIVSNPPYFKTSLLSKDYSRSIARHQIQLSINELLYCVSKLQKKQGKFYVIIPVELHNEIVKEGIMAGLFCNMLLKIKPTPYKNYNRSILVFEKKSKNLKEEEIIVKYSKSIYSDDYKKLMRDFYLNF